MNITNCISKNRVHVLASSNSPYSQQHKTLNWMWKTVSNHTVVFKARIWWSFPPRDTSKNFSCLFSYRIGGMEVSVVQQLRNWELGHQIHIFCFRNVHYFAPNEISFTKKKDCKKPMTKYAINQFLKYRVARWFKEIHKIKEKAHES